MTNIAMIGFGGVGQALVEILEEKRESLSNQHGLESKVVAVADLMKGAVYDKNGLDVQTLLECVRKDGSVETYPDGPDVVKGMSSIDTIEQTNADMIVEVTFTDVKTGEPAITHCKRAFASRKSVVTTNKGPIALAYKELDEMARENGVFFGFEGTVMSGTPALRMPEETLAGNEITRISGILNGTTNYILTEMEKGKSYKEALEQAQSYGYAEADPTNDVEGYDARYKVAILANYLMDAPLDYRDVTVKGISDMTIEDVQEALGNGQKWKLIGKVERQEDGSVIGSVKPEKVEGTHPLAGVTGATNAILYECDLLGPVLLTGAGAGRKETGFSLLIDLIHYQKERKLQTS
ncbi:homoserine dehydrogenase [Salimicrobium halophilum]|uniref:Homoserine dehydrogenase n=1 Tax=Salimicrobium halophilum TaxID=86666 RepID=A0A1G8RPA1_9BACI|nr:homoserine dehydrogenase [Salimicrobium halophilum]SDJ18325.1 homoserine dehydrogenase [Salimicrobium halophilum]